MAQIDLDQELVDFLRANESLTGEAPSAFLRKLLHKRQPKLAQKGRSDKSDLSIFLRILREIHEQSPERFSAVENVRGRTRIYFSRNPRDIESSGQSTFPVEIPQIGWWVTSNTSTDRKRAILEEVFRAVGSSFEDRHRWLAEFTDAKSVAVEHGGPSEDDDPFKI